MPERTVGGNGSITTCSIDDGEVPGIDVDFVHQPARDSSTFNSISNGHTEVIAELAITPRRKLPEWSVILQRVKRAAPIVGGLVAGTLTYEVLKRLQQERKEEERRKEKERKKEKSK